MATVGTAIVAAVFGCTGPALIIIDGADAAGLSAAQTVFWIFAVYVFGGLNSLLLALYYKQPIVGAWSIPGAVLVADALGSLPVIRACYNMTVVAGEDDYDGVPYADLVFTEVEWSEASEHIRNRSGRKRRPNEVNIEPEWAPKPWPTRDGLSARQAAEAG